MAGEINVVRVESIINVRHTNYQMDDGGGPPAGGAGAMSSFADP